jgi:hypothetical protein
MADYYLEPSLTHRNIIRDAETYASSIFRFIVLGVNVRIENRVIYLGLRASGRVTVTPAFAVVARWRIIAITV